MKTLVDKERERQNQMLKVDKNLHNVPTIGKKCQKHKNEATWGSHFVISHFCIDRYIWIHEWVHEKTLEPCIAH